LFLCQYNDSLFFPSLIPYYKSTYKHNAHCSEAEHKNKGFKIKKPKIQSETRQCVLFIA